MLSRDIIGGVALATMVNSICAGVVQGRGAITMRFAWLKSFDTWHYVAGETAVLWETGSPSAVWDTRLAPTTNRSGGSDVIIVLW